MNADYFLRKFEAIPEDAWCVRYYENHFGQHCAMGHCGIRQDSYSHPTPEVVALKALFASLGSSVMLVAYVNDGIDDRFPQETPKARILAALEAIKSQTKS